jgi:antitoxin MazE
MQPVMRARVVRIGNSRGIRIPKVWLEQLGLKDEVEMAVHKDGLLIRRPSHARQGWAQAFQAMAASKDDQMLDQPHTDPWDAEEWEW